MGIFRIHKSAQIEDISETQIRYLNILEIAKKPLIKTTGDGKIARKPLFRPIGDGESSSKTMISFVYNELESFWVIVGYVSRKINKKLLFRLLSD